MSLPRCLALAALLLAPAAVCQTAPTTVYVPAVRGPSGELLRSAAVKVALLPRLPVDYAIPPVWKDALTDARGALRVQGKSGAYRIWVRKPGVAVGGTGVLALRTGRETRADLPALCPTGSIRGEVLDERARFDGRVRLSSVGAGLLPGASELVAAVDAERRFVFYDVPAGRYRLQTSNPDTYMPGIDLQAGERVSGVSLRGPVAGRYARGMRFSLPSTATVVDGMVTDEKGRPLAGATVRGPGLVVYTDRLGGPAVSGLTQTGPAGTYRLASTGRLFGGITAEAPGKAPVTWAPRFGLGAGTAAQPQRHRIDLAVGGASGALKVQVLGDGQPLAGADVSLTTSDSLWISWDQPWSDTTTDLDGWARIGPLAPGRYEVNVSVGHVTGGRWRSAHAGNIIIRASETTERRIVLSDSDAAQSVLAMDRAGRALTGHSAIVWTAPAVGGPFGQAQMHRLQAAPGPWQLSVGWGLRQIRLTGIDARAPAGNAQQPKLEGAPLFAFSPALHRASPLALEVSPALLPQPDLPRGTVSSLAVRVLDPAGGPGRATVHVSGSPEWGEFVGVTSADGWVTFRNLPLGSHHITVTAIPSPAQEVWCGPTAVPVAVGKGPERLEVHLARAAYVAGVVRGASGRLPAEAEIWFTAADGRATRGRLDVASGEYRAGPLSPGVATYDLVGVERRHGIRWEPPPSVKLEAGSNRDVTLAWDWPNYDTAPEPAPLRAARLDVNAPTEDVPPPDLPLAALLLPDRATPAFGAVALIVGPGNDVSRPYRADARGRLAPQPSFGAIGLGGVAAGTASTAQIVAWLPGSYGAGFFPYPGRAVGDPLVLPRPARALGRLTVAGSPPDPASTYRVRAALQDRGGLNDLLSVEVTPQADGRFELAGLTPGRYLVQAARDDIWLSTARDVTIREGQTLTVSLDIGAIGRPVVAQLVDGAGRPLTHTSVKLHRPPGPLTDELWPATLEADDRGRLRLEGLEAGVHTIELDRWPGVYAIDVPALSGPARDWPIRVVVRDWR